ncbi:MAG TPA: amidase [Actinomycetota bacterium]|jgi:amidase
MDEPREPDQGTPGKVSRRRFLGYTALTGALAAGGPALPALTGTAGATSRTPASTRSASSAARGVLHVPHFKWEEATIAELQAAMEAGKLTSKHLTHAYIERIRQIDFKGVQLNSVLQINPDAEAIAEQLDRERKRKGSRGLLHGIPVLIKDNIATDDRMETTAGSLALLGSKVPRDSFMAKKLREAGAVILGKTNLSEWANFRSFQSSSGWSARGGQCLNPYVLDHNPCGSSSGSGAAPSANLCAAALGTETDGSVTCPSALNALAGIKPSLGLLSRSGIIPIAHSQDTAGPMARTVADMAAVLGPLTGVDPLDPITKDSIGHSFKDYTQFLDPNGLRGARIGVWRAGNFGFNNESDAIAEAAIAAMSDLGAVIVDPADIPHADEIFEPEFIVLLFEFKVDIAKYLSELSNTSMRTLADLIAFNDANADREMPWFGQELFLISEETDGLDDPTYKDALEKSKRLAGPEGIDAIMDQLDLDAIVAPVTSPPWTTDLVVGDHFTFGSTSPAAVAGYPNVAVLGGYAFEELPVGISFMGRKWSEPTLVKLAHSFEQGTKHRHAPRFLETLGTHDFIPHGGSREPQGNGHRGSRKGLRFLPPRLQRRIPIGM